MEKQMRSTAWLSLLLVIAVLFTGCINLGGTTTGITEAEKFAAAFVKNIQENNLEGMSNQLHNPMILGFTDNAFQVQSSTTPSIFDLLMEHTEEVINQYLAGDLDISEIEDVPPNVISYFIALLEDLDEEAPNFASAKASLVSKLSAYFLLEFIADSILIKGSDEHQNFLGAIDLDTLKLTKERITYTNDDNYKLVIDRNSMMTLYSLMVAGYSQTGSFHPADAPPEWGDLTVTRIGSFYQAIQQTGEDFFVFHVAKVGNAWKVVYIQFWQSN